MSTTTARVRQFTAVKADRWGILLAALFMAVLIGSVGLANWMAGMGTEPVMSESSGGEQAAGGAAWALAEVAVAVVAIGLILLYKRLPEWAQKIVKFAVVAPMVMYLGAEAASIGMFGATAAFLVGYFAIYKVTDAFDVYWLWNNVESIALATVAAAFVGVVLPLPFLIAGIVGLTIYDHVFADKKNWMFTLGEGMLRAKLPVIVFALPKLRASWDDICDSLSDESELDDEELQRALENSEGFGIGTADLLLPAAFASAVAVSGGGITLPVVGVAAGVLVAAFRLRWEMVNIGSGAGLPALTTGSIGGYALAMIPVVMVA